MKVPQKYEECIYWKDQEEGFLGYCLHPKARAREPCILNVEDYCRLRDPPMVDEPTSVHKCVICGNTMSCDDYEANGCIVSGTRVIQCKSFPNSLRFSSE